MSLAKTATTLLVLTTTLLAEPAFAADADDAAKSVATDEAVTETTTTTTTSGAEDAAKTSDLDVNAHTQNSAFEDGDHDMIEDLSVDPTLAAAEKAEQAEKEGEVVKPVGGKGIMDHIFDIDDSKPDDYVEEETTADGHHYKKHVHKGPGFQQVQIESDHPLNIGEIMGQLLG